MSGEMRLAGAALRWAPPAVLAATAFGYAVRGPRGAASVATAAALVLANTAISAGISALAGKLTPTGPAMIALPSFVFRMALMFGALGAFNGRAFIDEPSFVLAFCATLTFVLWMEARAWRRTPWLVLTFEPKERT